MKPTTSPGFTLMEVLVALLVVGLTLAAGFRVSATLTQTAERLAIQGPAQWCADNQLLAWRWNPQWQVQGEQVTACEQLSHTFEVRTRFSPTPNPAVARLDLSVVWQQQTVLQLHTVMGRY